MLSLVIWCIALLFIVACVMPFPFVLFMVVSGVIACRLGIREARKWTYTGLYKHRSEDNTLLLFYCSSRSSCIVCVVCRFCVYCCIVALLSYRVPLFRCLSAANCIQVWHPHGHPHGWKGTPSPPPYVYINVGFRSRSNFFSFFIRPFPPMYFCLPSL